MLPTTAIFNIEIRWIFTSRTFAILSRGLSHSTKNRSLTFTEDLDGLLRLVVRYLNFYTILLGTEELAELSISVAESINGNEHNNTAGSLHNLALLYRNQGRYDKAEP